MDLCCHLTACWMLAGSGCGWLDAPRQVPHHPTNPRQLNPVPPINPPTRPRSVTADSSTNSLTTGLIPQPQPSNPASYALPAQLPDLHPTHLRSFFGSWALPKVFKPPLHNRTSATSKVDKFQDVCRINFWCDPPAWIKLPFSAAGTSHVAAHHLRGQLAW